jgi:hypothetical protein
MKKARDLKDDAEGEQKGERESRRVGGGSEGAREITREITRARAIVTMYPMTVLTHRLASLSCQVCVGVTLTHSRKGEREIRRAFSLAQRRRAFSLAQVFAIANLC